jgi:hypothetical protein
MRSLAIVEREVARQPDGQFAHRALALQVHVFILDAAPQPFNEGVIQRPPGPIHADRNPFALKHAREGVARELRSPIAVEHLRLSVHSCADCRKTVVVCIPRRSADIAEDLLHPVRARWSGDTHLPLLRRPARIGVTTQWRRLARSTPSSLLRL